MQVRSSGERQELAEGKDHYREEHRRISDDLISPERDLASKGKPGLVQIDGIRAH